jgi:hypothetical protein
MYERWEVVNKASRPKKRQELVRSGLKPEEEW